MQRTGRKNDPHFRVIVTDSKRSPKTGNYVENIGFYNPKAGEFKIDADRAKHWLKVGAKTSDTVHNFLVSQKTKPACACILVVFKVFYGNGFV